ncbi:MAG: ABC transporter permease subunit, partial [Polyangiaceae bacterium]
RLPRTWEKIALLRGRISDVEMRKMNADAELRSESFSDIAARYVEHQPAYEDGSAVSPGPSEPTPFLQRLFGPDFLRLTGEHVTLVLLSLALGVIVGVPLGVWAARRPRAAKLILGSVGVIQTIPSLALLAFLIPVFRRIGLVPALAALFLYSLLPIVRNTYTGLTDIAPSLQESSIALGLPRLARLRLIELPLASRSILAGIKTSAVINVGTATIAAFIGAGGYGERIASGLALNDHQMLLAGAIPAAALALLAEAAFGWMEKLIVPRALRLSR